jgi:hypothetical protein
MKPRQLLLYLGILSASLTVGAFVVAGMQFSERELGLPGWSSAVASIALAVSTLAFTRSRFVYALMALVSAGVVVEYAWTESNRPPRIVDETRVMLCTSGNVDGREVYQCVEGRL